MVDDFLRFARRCQQVLQAPFPNCWVFAYPHAFGFGPVEDGLYSSTQPRCGFVASEPDGFKTTQDIQTPNGSNGQVSKNRAGMLRQCVGPLLRMFRIFPFWGFGLDVQRCALIKG